MQTKSVVAFMQSPFLVRVIISIVFGVLLTGCDRKDEIVISGKTMGTTYHVKAITGDRIHSADLRKKIIKRLREINKSMSTYIKDSEISRFNAISSAEKFYVSDDFIYVLSVAKHIHQLTDGAWDGTIKPLIKLWGFEDIIKIIELPSKKEIKKLLSNTGFGYIEISKKGYIRKEKDFISLDLASIAKGYAVDQIACLIRTYNIENFIVEIGGEVFASGVRKDGKAWKVGINMPQKDASFDDIYKVVLLKDKAFATSGDYRNFILIDGKTYSHVIDPKTGYPVTNGVVSVSIVADQCTFADGLATAVMVMGHKDGIELINKLDDVECLIVVREKNGTLADYYSKGFNKYREQDYEGAKQNS